MAYTTEENRKKALRVRELVKFGKMEDAELLSRELRLYLTKTQPSNFKKHSYWLSVKDWIEVTKYLVLDIETGLSVLNQLVTDFDIKVYDLIFLSENKHESLPFSTLIVFLDETGFTGIEYNSIIRNAPDQFYQFCETMGLLPRQANNLYNTNLSFDIHWPNITKNKAKLD